MTIVGAVVPWVSEIQKKMTVSSNEAEYVAMWQAIQDVVFPPALIILTMSAEQHQPRVRQRKEQSVKQAFKTRRDQVSLHSEAAKR